MKKIIFYNLLFLLIW